MTEMEGVPVGAPLESVKEFVDRAHQFESIVASTQKDYNVSIKELEVSKNLALLKARGAAPRGLRPGGLRPPAPPTYTPS